MGKIFLAKIPIVEASCIIKNVSGIEKDQVNGQVQQVSRGLEHLLLDGLFMPK